MSWPFLLFTMFKYCLLEAIEPREIFLKNKISLYMFLILFLSTPLLFAAAELPKDLFYLDITEKSIKTTVTLPATNYDVEMKNTDWKCHVSDLTSNLKSFSRMLTCARNKKDIVMTLLSCSKELNPVESSHLSLTDTKVGPNAMTHFTLWCDFSKIH